MVDIRLLRDPCYGHWLLARRSISDPAEIAYYVCFGSAGTAVSELVRVAGSRWAIEECFPTAKNETGLDHYQVRDYTHLVPAYHLVHGRRGVLGPDPPEREKGGPTDGAEPQLIPLTIHEIRRLFNRIAQPVRYLPEHIWYWSSWRRTCQARARTSHYKRRGHNLSLQY